MSTFSPGVAIGLLALVLFTMVTRVVVGGEKTKNVATKVVYPAGYVEEAPLPEGFPPPSNPGEIVEKEYPASRTYNASGGEGAFWKLFGYLQLKQHEMTAPVVMSFDESKKKEKPADSKDMVKREVDRMHFVLLKPSLDTPKNFGFVKVSDTPAMRVLSIATQGDATAEAIAKSEQALREELARRTDLEVAGELRMLGYNSPSVAPDSRYWELQLPVKSKSP